MAYHSLSMVNAVYASCEHCTLHSHGVEHMEVYNLYSAIAQFDKNLGRATDDPFWRSLLWDLKRYRFSICAAPLPVNWRFGELIPTLQQHLVRSRFVYPSAASCLESLFNQIIGLRQCQDNPLLQKITEIADTAEGSSVVLLKKSWLVPPVEATFKTLAKLHNVEIATPYQMRSLRCRDIVILLGSPSWYTQHEYVFSAPRAREVHVVNYKWIGSRWKPEPIFLKSTNTPPGTGIMQKLFPVSSDSALINDLERDLLPEIDWTQIAARIPESDTASSEEGGELLQARLYLLANNAAVLLEGSGDTAVLVLNAEVPDEGEDNSTVSRLSVSELKIGMFILLRTSGGGDYIVPLADQILGKDAFLLRRRQKNWKALLKRAVKESGVHHVARALERLGAIRANEINIRNWMSNSTIRPRSEEDFQAILRLVKLEKEYITYNKTAEAIDKAHRQAGHLIRQRLLEKARHADPEALHRYGKLDFELSNGDGGSITAYRIEDISPDTYEVPEFRLGHVFNLERSQWHV